MFLVWPIFTPFYKVGLIPKGCYLLLRELKDQREYIHQRLSQTKDSLCPKSLKLLRRKVSLEVKPAVGIKPLAQHSLCKHTHHFPVWLASAIFFESLISSCALDNFSLPKISLRQQCFYFICNSISVLLKGHRIWIWEEILACKTKSRLSKKENIRFHITRRLERGPS